MASNAWTANGVNPQPSEPTQVRYSNDRMAQTQAQVNEVVVIMKTNVEKIQEREGKLSDLETRSEALTSSAAQFQRQSTVLRKKMWWKNLKWTIFLGILVTLIVVVIIVMATKSSDSNESSSKTIIEKLIFAQNETATPAAVEN